MTSLFKTPHDERVAGFQILAKKIEVSHSVALHLLRRAGHRTEYVWGKVPDDPVWVSKSKMIDFEHGWSVQIYHWESLNAAAQESLKKNLEYWDIRHHEWSREELVGWLARDEKKELIRLADLVREAVCGNEVHRRGLIEFSNYCARECAYCGLRRGNRKLQRYRMDEGEIFESAKLARQLGYRSVVLQSGEDGAVKVEMLCRVVEKIKKELGLAITLSVGEKKFEDYKCLREAGADRYLLRFETSNPVLFKSLKPDSSLERRLECLRWLKELGYQVGSGCMIGLPGQTLEDLADDLLLLKKLDLDMVGVGPFIAHPETPLSDGGQGSLEQVLKFVALARIVTLDTHIPATTALGSIHPLGRELALDGGANVIMPNVTPQKYRRYYEIYPHKICITEKPSDCSACTGSMVHTLGRKLAVGPGHSLKLSPQRQKAF